MTDASTSPPQPSSSQPAQQASTSRPASLTEPDYDLYAAGPDAPNADPAGVFKDLPESARAVRERARAFALEKVAPVIDDYWHRGEYPAHLTKELGEADLLRDGIAVDGREGWNRLEAAMVGMELGRVDLSVSTIVGVQGGLALRSIDLCGSEEQKQKWGPALAEGSVAGAFALTEPTHGSDSIGLETMATKVDGGWRITGAKKWIGNGAIGPEVGAPAISVVWARDTDDGQVKGFIVPQDAEGYSAFHLKEKIALRCLWQAEIDLQDVFVPEENVLPGAQSFKNTAQVLFATRLGVAWAAVGAAMGAYEVAAQYASKRMQFGRPLAHSQIVNERLARMQSTLVQAQLLALHCTELEDRGELSGELASLAKFTSTRAARSIAADARDLLGGNGILIKNRVARHFADIEALHTYEGTETVQALLIGRGVTGKSTFAG